MDADQQLDMLIKIAEHARSVMRRTLVAHPTTRVAPVYLMLVTKDPSETVAIGTVPIAPDDDNRLQTLRGYFQSQPDAWGLVMAADGEAFVPALGRRRALLMLALHRNGNGRASALPYTCASPGALPDVQFWPEEIPAPEVLSSYTVVFDGAVSSPA